MRQQPITIIQWDGPKQDPGAIMYVNTTEAAADIFERWMTGRGWLSYFHVQVTTGFQPSHVATLQSVLELYCVCCISIISRFIVPAST